jgi:uncharacterized protein (DUF4415 family)
MKDKDIDTSDIPPVSDRSKAVVGKFYRPIKKPLTIRLDSDILDWLRRQGRGYQTRINMLLRSALEKAISDVTAEDSTFATGKTSLARRQEK